MSGDLLDCVYEVTRAATPASRAITYPRDLDERTMSDRGGVSAVPAAFTTVTMTYNLWGSAYWEARVDAVRALFTTRAPDILAVQELRPASRTLLDEVLAGHDRVDDEFDGWSRESNIWWRRDLYELEEYGAEEIGLREKLRRLFWVRLRPLALESGPSVLFATAHYTWPGNAQECADDVSPRVGQARRTVEELERLMPDGPRVFVGDLNDYARPIRVLREAGYLDSFAALGRTSPATHPVFPNARGAAGDVGLESVSKAIDLQFHQGPITPRTSEVVDFFHQGMAPSDHYPVVVTYTLGPNAQGTG